MYDFENALQTIESVANSPLMLMESINWVLTTWKVIDCDNKEFFSSDAVLNLTIYRNYI